MEYTEGMERIEQIKCPEEMEYREGIERIEQIKYPKGMEYREEMNIPKGPNELNK